MGEKGQKLQVRFGAEKRVPLKLIHAHIIRGNEDTRPKHLMGENHRKKKFFLIEFFKIVVLFIA